MSIRSYAWFAILGLAAHGERQTVPGTLTTILEFDTSRNGLPETGVVVGSNVVLYSTAARPTCTTIYSLAPPSAARVGRASTPAAGLQTCPCSVFNCLQ